MVRPAKEFEQRRHRRAFGDRIRQLRADRHWTQERLAEASGLDRSYIAGVEAGRRNISLDAIVDLAEGLDVPPAQLFASEADMEQQ